MIVHLSQETFETEVLSSEKPVLIDFYADWCGPCQMLAPVIDEIAEETPDIKVCKINVDEEPELARQFRVLSIPTLVVMKDGEVANRATGVRPKEAILDLMSGE